ncbi:hypothetical protein RJ639_029364 [Escallonia herrerae]|uniref:Uncharacterized protein n=1 Tax=Escallonia herrerae TaxID=1293975 RepID=A0AA89BCU1_9ASTE|nr:hypothetical protein RJ639_029364 [Escallonia herrerae]
MYVIIRWKVEFWHMAEQGEGLEQYNRGCQSTHEEPARGTWRALAAAVASQVELVFNRLDDLEVNSRLAVLEKKVDVFAEELDDLIEEKWVTTELSRRKPHDLASGMAIVERLEDFKQGERRRSLRHERAKDGGDGRSKRGSPKATDDERSGDEGRRRHHKGKKKHEGSCKQGDSRDHKAHGRPRGGCFYCAGPRYERYCPDKEVVKNVDLRIDGWTGKVDFNIIDMDELGVVLGMDFMEKSSATLNPYCGVMMMAEWMIPLVFKDGTDARKGITVLQLDKRLTLCYSERQIGPRTCAVNMLTKTVMTKKFKHCLSLIRLLSC